MITTNVYLESGKNKIFAGAVDWPGWCRSGRDEDSAKQALISYGLRYAHALHKGEMEFTAPIEVSGLIVIERYDGNSTTDFGAPAVVPDADKEPVDQINYQRFLAILQSCWSMFDGAAKSAYGKQLQKGPRGGGRDLDKIIKHVIDADRSYLSRLAWKNDKVSGMSLIEELTITRQAILNAIDKAVNVGLPEKGPRGGIIWPVRYFIRRAAWHVLDHAWEIEDRIV